jgi:hypothetical protein
MTVYVMQCQQSRNIKIGYTSRLVNDRIKELSTAASTPLQLVRWYPGLTQAHEQQLHATLGQYRVTGEWFTQEALHHVDHAAETLFVTGEKDFTVVHQGKAVKAQTASVSIAVLKVNGQNLKKSLLDQLPCADFGEVFDDYGSGVVFDDDCTPWGWVRTKDYDALLTEIRGVLHSNIFSLNHSNELTNRSYEEARYMKWLHGGGSIDSCGVFYEFWDASPRRGRKLNAQGKQDFDSYIQLIRSLPQLFLV